MSDDLGSKVLIAAWAAASSVARPLVMCMFGYFMAKYRMNVGGKDTWRDVGRLNAELLQPCLALAAFVKGLDLESLAELWPVLVLGLLFPFMWLWIGGFGAKLLLAKDQQDYVVFAATAVAYPNGFAIPYPILLGLRREVNFIEERGDEYSATVAMLFAFLNMLHIWTVGFYLYGRAAKREREQEAEKVRKEVEAEAMAIEAEHGQASGSSIQSEHMQGQGGDGEGSDTVADEAAVESHQPSVAESPKGPSHTKNTMRSELLAQPLLRGCLGAEAAGARVDSSSSIRRAISTVSIKSMQAWESTWTALSHIANPLVGTLVLAIAIAVSPARKPLVKSVIYDVVHFIGEAAAPLALLQIGAGMVRSPSSSASAPDGMHMRSALIIAGLRLVVANVAGAGVVTAFRHAGWIENRHLALIMYLECCPPTAANLVLVSSIQHAYVQPVSVTVFVMQIAAVVTMTISVAVAVIFLS